MLRDPVLLSNRWDWSWDVSLSNQAIWYFRFRNNKNYSKTFKLLIEANDVIFSPMSCLMVWSVDILSIQTGITYQCPVWWCDKWTSCPSIQESLTNVLSDGVISGHLVYPYRNHSPMSCLMVWSVDILSIHTGITHQCPVWWCDKWTSCPSRQESLTNVLSDGVISGHLVHPYRNYLPMSCLMVWPVDILSIHTGITHQCPVWWCDQWTSCPSIQESLTNVLSDGVISGHLVHPYRNHSPMSCLMVWSVDILSIQTGITHQCPVWWCDQWTSCPSIQESLTNVLSDGVISGHLVYPDRNHSLMSCLKVWSVDTLSIQTGITYQCPVWWCDQWTSCLSRQES